MDIFGTSQNNDAESKQIAQKFGICMAKGIEIPMNDKIGRAIACSIFMPKNATILPVIQLYNSNEGVFCSFFKIQADILTQSYLWNKQGKF